MNSHDNRATTFSAISEANSRELLRRHSLGRIAYSFHNRVDIEPLNYVVDADWIYGRTSAGSKVATLAHQHWCAFEVDEVRSMFDWTSVVVQGTFHLLSSEGESAESYRHAITVLRAFYADTLLADDYAPHRTTLFRIYIDSISGRSARPNEPDAAAAAE